MESMDERNVVLTGFMGTGKSTVGRRLAELLDREFVDTDSVIEERHGPIPAIFAELGEAVFRAIERDLADELAASEGLVVATGGGLMVDEDNAATLGGSGRVFCLTAPVEVVLARIRADDDAPLRPLLDHDDPVAAAGELLERRRPAYAAFEQVDTDGRTPDEIVEDLIGRLDRT